MHTLTVIIQAPHGEEVARYVYEYAHAADFRASLPTINDHFSDTPFGPAFFYRTSGVEHRIGSDGTHVLSSTAILMLEPHEDF